MASGKYLSDRDRSKQLARVLQIIELLRRRQMSVYDLAAEFGVTVRTIRRDVLLIQRAGAIVDLTVRRKLVEGNRLVTHYSIEASR